MAYLVTGDFSAFARELPEVDRQQRYRRFLDGLLADEATPPTHAEAVAVLPTARALADDVVFVRVRAKDKTIGEFAVYFGDGKMRALGVGGGNSDSLSMGLVAGGDGLVGYDPVSGAVARFRVGDTGELLIRTSARAADGDSPVRLRRAPTAQ